MHARGSTCTNGASSRVAYASRVGVVASVVARRSRASIGRSKGGTVVTVGWGRRRSGVVGSSALLGRRLEGCWGCPGAAAAGWGRLGLRLGSA